MRRGDLTVWFTPDAIAAWEPGPRGRRGGQQRYSNVAIETALCLRLVFRLARRQTEGLLGSLLTLMDLPLTAPDHTTLSRRSQHLALELRPMPTAGPVHLIVDATGLKIVGEGEWTAAKYGHRKGRRGWRKLHVGVDEQGNILAAQLTDKDVADATALPGLLDQVEATVSKLTADGAYDRRPVYEAAWARGASTVIPPHRGAVHSDEPALDDRNAHIERVEAIGRRRWRAEARHHLQARAENTFYRYKATFGGQLRARAEPARRNEVIAACNILNRMYELGRPESIAQTP